MRQGLEGPPGPQSGYVLHTLRTAAHFSASPDFLPGVGAIAARGDDSDTAAAVAGALLAAAGHPVPDRLLARLHCLHRGWRLWTPPGGAADLEAFVP